VARVIEIGLGSAPTQANMFKATLSMDPSRLDPPAVLNVEGDRKAVFHLYDAEAEVDLSSAAPAAAPAATASAPSAPAAPQSARAAVTDAAPTVRECLLTLLALKTRVRLDEIKADENIELLSGGNSSRRNQIMADLGNEFGIGSIDAAHEMPLGTLVAAVEKATQGRYKAPGPYLRAQITAALKPFGLSVKDVLCRRWPARGLPEGRSLSRCCCAPHCGCGRASRPAPARSRTLAPAGGGGSRGGRRVARRRAGSLRPPRRASRWPPVGGGGGGATVDAAALEGLLARYFGVGGAFLESLRFAEAALGRDVWAELEARALEVGTAPPARRASA
jgi:hypothetical protein